MGNVKDIVSLGGDDAVGEVASIRSARGATQNATPYTSNGSEAFRASSSSFANAARASISGSEQHSPIGTRFSDSIHSSQSGVAKTSKANLGSQATSSKFGSVSLRALKNPPATLTQAVQPTTVSPALAEVNISAVKHPSPSNPYTPDAKPTREVIFENGGRKVPSHHTESAEATGTDLSVVEGSESRNSYTGSPKEQINRLYEVGRGPGLNLHDRASGAGVAERSHSQISEDTVQPFPSVDTGKEDQSALGSSIDGEDDVEPSKIVTRSGNLEDDVFHVSDNQMGNSVTRENVRKGSSQHLEIPLRKGVAPPLITRSHPPKSNMSTASSSEVNVDRAIESPFQQLSHPASTKHPGLSNNDRFTAYKSGFNHDLNGMSVFSQVKNKVLDKEYWMKDENARDCFYCGDAFSTFRRKHHCRTCGQIFDSKCTLLISGGHFGQSGSLRVCKPCEGIINGQDDSSEFSDDGNLSVRGMRPRHGSTGASDTLASPFPGSSPPVSKGGSRSSKRLDLKIPTMSIPATRKAGGESGRKPTVLEIGADRTLARPSSSRSLKSSFGSKSYHSAHRRQHSRHLFQRGFRPVVEDSAPFHQIATDNKRRSRQLPVFHDDNIIDPDLAPYLSDQESSEDEPMSILAALNGDELSRSHDNDRHGFSGLLASSRKVRSRVGDKSLSGVMLASRDGDNHSLSSLKSGNAPRSSKRRNLSVTANVHLWSSPRNYRAGPGNLNYGSTLHESTSGSALTQDLPVGGPSVGARMIRSSSMRGAAAPAVELNNASLRHVRKLLHQLLEGYKVPNIGRWEKALIPILLRATDDVNPDVQNGDDIDIRHYVKIKRIPGGRPGDTSYVSGLVFTKNLALKCMPRNISKPRILILTFPLEYTRHQLHFMSLEPVIRQEREFLQNLVNRIAVLEPQLLLVERNVAGLALEFLQQADIATAYNVKASVLEAVSRCCQTRIISSIDKLAIKPAQTGTCENFYLKTYIHGSRKKTYTFLDGCAKELGCTIVLRGDDDAILGKMKRITDFMIYVVYNLKLETCLMRDEFASIPAITELGTLAPRRDAAPRTVAASHGSEGVITMFNANSLNHDPSQRNGDEIRERAKVKPSLPEEESVPDDIPMPTFYGDMVEEHQTKILSASPFVKFIQPYLLMRAREQERRLAYLKRLRDQDIVEEHRLEENPKQEKFDLIKPEMIHEKVDAVSKKMREVIHAVHDAEYDKALHHYQTQTKQWETYMAGSIDLLDPNGHQNIAVLYSLVCTVTTVPCSGPDILAFEFYNEVETNTDFEADCTLGQYVEDLCLGGPTVCTSNGCERRMFEHHRQYVHGEAQLSVFVEHYPCRLRGLQDTILMWSTCRKCGKETQVLPMSESTWKYSFGKYLELSFWSSELHARADVCPHDLHRDHLRYFGFKDVALRVHYDPITLLEIIVPRSRITWKVDNDLRFKNEVFTKIEDRLNKFMMSVKARIKSINTGSVLPEKVESCTREVERLSKRASEEHLALVQKLREKYMNSKHYEIIPLNRAIRAIQEKVAEWDSAFADFDHNFFPSEKDIRRLATLQLKKIFLDRDESVTSLMPSERGLSEIIPEAALNEKALIDETLALSPQTRRMSPEKANDMLAAVVEKNASVDDKPDQHQTTPATAQPLLGSSPTKTARQHFDTDKVDHLDLAFPSPTMNRCQNIEIDGGRIFEQVPGSVQGQGHAALNEPGKKENLVHEDGIDAPAAASKVAVTAQSSGIPRPIDASQRRTKTSVSPTLFRTHSQPTHLRNDKLLGSASQSPSPFVPSLNSESQAAERHGSPGPEPANTTPKKPGERKISDRLGLSAIKSTNVSMIPRSIASRRQESKVSNLAKHFEQLSREFEKERIRERRQRAAKSRQARAYPMAASKPIVQIYRNVHEAVEEKEPSDESLLVTESLDEHVSPSEEVDNPGTEEEPSQTLDKDFHVPTEETTAENTETEDNNLFESTVGSDVEGEGTRSDGERSMLGDIHVPGDADEHHALSPEEAQLDVKLDLPKHEKSSLMKMLTNFWAERSASGWQSLEYPLNATDHIFADSDIIVREDEPSSLIAFALGSEDYRAKLRSIIDSDETSPVTNSQEKPHNSGSPSNYDEAEHSLLRPTGKHLKYQFAEGSAKMLCKVFYAEQFDALRIKCGVSERIVESLSRCAKWDSKGGKTKSVFLKTLDDRFVLKSLSQIEAQSFLRFAPDYFHMMWKYFFRDLPSVIAKMLGFFQITIKNPATGVDFNWSLLIMENLFYDRSATRTFDLKGSMRNRRIQSTGEQNEVLLDENMVDFIYETPLFCREHSKRLLSLCVFNDTFFLAKQNVMDYSLMIAIDENRKELVVGIIDCIRTYTWDKKLETWIKDRGKNRPTVTSPKEYKSRFRSAMSQYVLLAPNCWHQFKGQAVENRRLRIEDQGDE